MGFMDDLGNFAGEVGTGVDRFFHGTKGFSDFEPTRANLDPSNPWRGSLAGDLRKAMEAQMAGRGPGGNIGAQQQAQALSQARQQAGAQSAQRGISQAMAERLGMGSMVAPALQGVSQGAQTRAQSGDAARSNLQSLAGQQNMTDLDRLRLEAAQRQAFRAMMAKQVLFNAGQASYGDLIAPLFQAGGAALGQMMASNAGGQQQGYAPTGSAPAFATSQGYGQMYGTPSGYGYAPAPMANGGGQVGSLGSGATIGGAGAIMGGK